MLRDSIALKQKLSFSYFHARFAKIYFRFLQKFNFAVCENLLSLFAKIYFAFRNNLHLLFAKITFVFAKIYFCFSRKFTFAFHENLLLLFAIIYFAFCKNFLSLFGKIYFRCSQKFTYAFRKNLLLLFAKIYFRFLRKFTFAFRNIFFRLSQKFSDENLRQKISPKIWKNKIFFIKLESTFTSGLWKTNFFYHLFINSSIFDQPCMDGPGETGEDSQCRILRTGHLGQGM
jgi:hypothetical protein